MDYVAQGGSSTSSRPGSWAIEREAEGWFGLSAPDHISTTMGTPVPWKHVFVTLTEMACATSRVHLGPSFGNNLARSPVEFAQAALAIHDLSGGRYEASLGAGWARDEVVGMGHDYPDDRARARRFHEALRIVRDLLDDGACRFDGEHYRIDISGLAPLTDSPPPLVAAVAGPWTASNVSQLVDRVEIALPGSAHPMTGGVWDGSRLGQLRWDDIARMCDRIRSANTAVRISCGLLYAAGPGAEVAPMKAAFGDGLIASVIGEPAEVAARLESFADLGIDRITLMPLTPDSHASIAPHLHR